MFDMELILKIFFLLSPLSSIPLLFLAYQQKMNVQKVAVHSAVLALLVSFGFVLVGPLLFTVYGISIDSFRVAGGVLVFLMGLSMANDHEHNYAKMKADKLINMIATPLLAGPAILSFLIIKTAEIGSIPVIVNLLGAFLLVASLFLLLAYLIKHISLSYVMFVNRLFGLFLVALGIEMMVMGLKVLLFG
ncbi:MAG: MarC family protein [Candidatus Micrarchaeia archaeon]|jgi:multiple antibiotic resistance protein